MMFLTRTISLTELTLRLSEHSLIICINISFSGLSQAVFQQYTNDLDTLIYLSKKSKLKVKNPHFRNISFISVCLKYKQYIV